MTKTSNQWVKCSMRMVLSGWSQAEARASLSCGDGAGSLEQLNLWGTQEEKFRELEAPVKHSGECLAAVYG